MEADVEKDMVERKEITLQPTEQSMEEELVSRRCVYNSIAKITSFKESDYIDLTDAEYRIV